MSSNKAVTFDGFCDTWIKNTKRLDLLSDLWKKQTFIDNPLIGEARLVPLNKVWPLIPKQSEFRPIIILSSLFKFMELQFLPNLHKYNLEKLDRN